MDFLIQTATMAILILAANSAFAGLPRLASLLARGIYARQMAEMGDRLVFSNGIIEDIDKRQRTNKPQVIGIIVSWMYAEFYLKPVVRLTHDTR
jgi:hypothetical protein